MRRTIILLAVALVLLIVGSSMARSGLTAPKSKEEEVTRLTYEIKGGLDQHQAYRRSTKWKEQPNPRYFPKIIDSIVVSYSYKFLPSEPVSRVTGQAEISAVVKSPGMWEKEVPLVSQGQTLGDFSISFPLNTAEFIELSDNISEEIGVGAGSPQLILTATVHTEAETQFGVLKDNFIQTCQVDLSEKTIQWHRPFTFSRKGYWEGLTYEHQGSFSYAIKLKPNILFGETTLQSVTLATEPPVILARSSSYPADTTDTVEVTLSYQLDSDQTVTQVRHEVEVNAVLSKPEREEILFRLVPKSELAGDFTIVFPLDIALFYDIIGAVEEATEDPLTNYELMITADVHTVAQSGFGVIDEVIRPSLVLTLEPERLVWPAATEETKSGSFKEMVVVPVPSKTTTIMGSLGILGMAVAFLLFAGWSYKEAKHLQVPIPEVEAEAIQAKKKHKDVIVDVQALPPRGGHVVIPLDSLDELVKVADALLKPVLHRAEVEKHTYYVTDELTIYEYLSLRSPGREEESS